MKFVDLLDSSLVAFLESGSQQEAIEELIQLLDEKGKLPNRKAFQGAILQREQIVSTGIGMGVAVPHAKLSTLKNFFIAIGVLRKQGVEWNALDKAPVRLIFLIGGPDNRQSEYLQILSQLTTAVRDVELRKNLLKARTAQEVISLLYPT